MGALARSVTVEDAMPGPIGPTIPRWQLGEQLGRLREKAHVTQAQIADRLGCPVSKIQKVEAGEVGMVKVELEVMLDEYKVLDEAMVVHGLLQTEDCARAIAGTVALTSTDDQRPDGPALVFTAEQWDAFIASAATGAFTQR